MVTFKRTSELGYRQNLVGKLYIHDSSLEANLHTYEVEPAKTGPDFPEEDVRMLMLLFSEPCKLA